MISILRVLERVLDFLDFFMAKIEEKEKEKRKKEIEKVAEDTDSQLAVEELTGSSGHRSPRRYKGMFTRPKPKKETPVSVSKDDDLEN
jgi:hypothetical protein